MIGALNPTERQVSVVGAGVAGLLAAYELDRAGFEVSLVERAARAGGLISTERTEWGPAESAAHSLLATEPVFRLCEELGVELCPVARESRARYVWRAGRLRRFPLTVAETAELVWRATTARAVEDRPDMGAFAEKHLGRAARDYLISPFLAGIHAAGPGAIDVGAAFPRLGVAPGRSLAATMLRRRRPRGRAGRKAMVAPRDGMGSLTDALERRLEERLGSRFRKGVALDRLPETPNLVLCVPAAAAAELVAPIDEAAARALAGIAYTPLVSATVFLERSSVRRPPRGVGVLVPERERSAGVLAEAGLLGVLFNSSSFAGRVADDARLISVTAMMGGQTHPTVVDRSDADIRAALARGLDALFGLSGPPVGFAVHRWPRALPLYSRALVDAWSTLERTWCRQPGRVIFGNYSGELSVRGMIETAAGRLGPRP